jgi:hypothetical protein
MSSLETRCKIAARRSPLLDVSTVERQAAQI